MLSTHRSRTNTGEGNLVGQIGAGNNPIAASAAQVGATKPPTAQERRELAEADIKRTADRAAATEAERYRSGQLAEGVGGNATGAMYGQIGTGGGYRIDPDTLAAKIPGWEDMLAEIELIKRDFIEAENLAQSPVQFPPADRQAEDTRKCARRGSDHAQAVHDYLAGWIKAAKEAHGSYSAKEDEAQQTLSTSKPDEGADDGTGSLYKKAGK